MGVAGFVLMGYILAIPAHCSVEQASRGFLSLLEPCVPPPVSQRCVGAGRVKRPTLPPPDPGRKTIADTQPPSPRPLSFLVLFNRRLPGH